MASQKMRREFAEEFRRQLAEVPESKWRAAVLGAVTAAVKPLFSQAGNENR